MGAASDFIQIVDAALAQAATKAGPWLACRPGCTQCCFGPFAITPADAARLRQGLAQLDPETAARVRRRSRESVARLEAAYPVDTIARILAEDEAAADEPCPALDPETGLCDLYAARPIVCRTFGPPLHFPGEAVAICELCFEGAEPEQVAACEVEIEMDNPEEQGPETVVAYALALA